MDNRAAEILEKLLIDLAYDLGQSRHLAINLVREDYEAARAAWTRVKLTGPAA